MSVISSIGSLLSNSINNPVKPSTTTNVNSASTTGISLTSNINESDEAASGIEKIFEQVEQDPLFAKEMVEIYTFIPDREIYDANDVPSDIEAWRAFQDRTNQFSQIAEDVTEQRIEIYKKMKAENIPDAEIFKSLMEFNKSLPMDYQLKTGLSRYSIYV
ncbi:hypothetical protein [Cellvibrio mixtus]|uniref:hypothetical protein n=1 Tax=Cellvibrio mixtus TaxID=39650 RepID=UPI0005867FEE|nr:hypothetical protein [Cellvibrio mixtus]